VTSGSWAGNAHVPFIRVFQRCATQSCLAGRWLVVLVVPPPISRRAHDSGEMAKLGEKVRFQVLVQVQVRGCPSGGQELHSCVPRKRFPRAHLISQRSLEMRCGVLSSVTQQNEVAHQAAKRAGGVYYGHQGKCCNCRGILVSHLPLYSY
jgi:hypothetical protein